MDVGPSPGDQIFEGQAGGLTTAFYATVRPLPVIGANAVKDAASFQVGNGLAPGSYISIGGTNLSDATLDLST
jgi:tetrahydromethanopterin S-methyltransferase subunit C